MSRPLNGMFHVREVGYAPPERVGRAEAVGTPLSVVVKPAGVEHSDEFGIHGARTVQMAFDPGMLSALTEQDPTFRPGGGIMADGWPWRCSRWFG